MESNGPSTGVKRSVYRGDAMLADKLLLMRKLLIYVLLVFLAVVLAGLYGIAHNQISYTVSPEYFTKFKFQQFGFVDMPLPERVRASMVGFLASWWMGIPIADFCAPATCTILLTSAACWLSSRLGFFRSW